MLGFIENIAALTKGNEEFRHVIYTGKHLQLVLMTLAPNEEIGSEIHVDNDQFFRVEAGQGIVVIDGAPTPIKAQDAILIPAGARHNVLNDGTEPLKLFSLYGPPDHRDGVVHHTLLDAVTDEEHFDGVTSE